MKRTIAHYIAEQLAILGIEKCFMVTGGGAMHLNDAFGKNSKLEKIHCHHEQACAMAAESYARMSGKPAVLQATTGPGGINTLNGVYGAYVDSIPIIIVAGQVRRDNIAPLFDKKLRQFGDQETNLIDIIKPITKYANTIYNEKDLPIILEKAYLEAISGRPGPVCIEVPIDIQGSFTNKKPKSKKLILKNKKEFKPKINDIKNLVREISNAKRPIIIAGNGVRFSGQSKNLLKLAKKAHIPVTTVWNSHDLIGNDHMCYAGRTGADGERAGNFNVQNADLILILGARMHIRQVGFNYKSFGRNAKKIMVDIDEVETRKPSLNINYKIISDLKYIIPELLIKFSKKKPYMEHANFLKWCNERVNNFKDFPDSNKKLRKKEVNPYLFINTFFNKLNPGENIVTGDGSAAVMTFKFGKVKENQRLYTNKGCASMGYDLPAAIGAYLATNKQVYCITGDGSIMMNIQELQTISGNNYPIKILILNNGGYLSIKQTQTNYFNGFSVGCGPESGLTFPDYKYLSKGFKIPYMKISNEIEMNKKINRLLNTKGPIICEIMINKNYFFEPKVSSKRLPNGDLVSMPLEDMSPYLSREEFKKNMIIPLAEESKEI